MLCTLTFAVVSLAFAAGPNFDSLDTGDCMPPCRPGYFCRDGVCLSRCNPPCPAGADCTNEGRCVKLGAPADTVLVPASSEPQPKPAPQPRPLPVKRAISCPRALVVRPVLTADRLGGSFTDDELTNAATLLAQPVAVALDAEAITDLDGYGGYAECSCRVAFIEVTSYHRQPARMNQNEGVLSVKLVVKRTPSSAASDVLTFTGTGKPHWGESVPLENACKEVAEQIAKTLKRRY